MSSKGKCSEKSAKQVVKDKMRILDDFGVCDINNKDMIAELEGEIAKHPNKDPRIVLDTYCRPMIQAKVNSWQ